MTTAPPFQRYARLFLDVLPALRKLPAWQRWIYVESVAECDRSTRPISKARLAKACGTTPRNVRKALLAAERLELVKIDVVKGDTGGDLGLRLSFPWASPPGCHPVTSPGSQPVTPPGGQPVTPPGGQPVTPPGGQPVTPSRPALLFVPDRSQIDRQMDPPTPPEAHSRARAHESPAGEGGRDGASPSWDRSWTIESIRDVLAHFPRTPERGGLVPKWLARIVHRGEPTLRELRAYLRAAAKDPELAGWKYPLAGACQPDRWDRWLAAHRAGAVAAEAAKASEDRDRAEAGAKLAARLDAVRRAKASAESKRGASHSASKSDDAMKRGASSLADVLGAVGAPGTRPARRLSGARTG